MLNKLILSLYIIILLCLIVQLEKINNIHKALKTPVIYKKKTGVNI